MKLLQFLLILCVSFSASAARVLLLSSVETPKIWFHSKDWEIEDSLEKIFKNRFKESGLEIVIKEKVDQVTLWKELNNPENMAIFWLSHAADEKQLASGISSDSAIVDFYGNDIKSLFSRVHPNLKFLGLVGCNAQGILDTFNEKGFYKLNKDFKYHSFSKKIDARKGLRRAIEAAANHLGKYDKKFASIPRVKISQNMINSFSSNNLCEQTSKVLEINITRSTNSDSPPVTLSVNDQVFEMLPEQKANTTMHIKTYLQATLIKSSNDLKITVHSNIFASKDRIELGDFEVQPVNFIGSWTTFSKKDGTPIGITSNLIRYKGDLPSDEDIIEKQLFKCLN